MQSQVLENQETAVGETLHEGASTPAASLYRTKWLMAHNALHAAAHNQTISLPDIWAAYLSDLETAEEKASVSA